MRDGSKIIFAEERQEEILRLLNERKKIVVPELCDYFGVSASTIRNDMRELEREKLLTRTRGGAIVKTKTGSEPSPEFKDNLMKDEKLAIAEAAIGSIEEGDTVAILTGTTTFELLQLLPNKKKLLVITNDLRFADWLDRNTDFDMLILGGMVRKKFHYTTSSLPNEYLGMINIDKVFFTCNGISVERGITTPDLETARFTRDVIKASNEAIVLADSTKIGGVSFAQILALNQVDEVITDDGIEEDDYKSFAAVTNVKVVAAKNS